MTKFGDGPLKEALAQEAAVSLGLAGRRLRVALDNLRRMGTADPESNGSAQRRKLVEHAAEACWAYVVQREVLGFGAEDAQQIRRQFAVPDEVWSLLGSRQG